MTEFTEAWNAFCDALPLISTFPKLDNRVPFTEDMKRLLEYARAAGVWKDH